MNNLTRIQTELNCPKTLYNSFGKYYFRSNESILEAVKPFLAKYNCELIITDEVKQIGDLIYIEATAEFIDGESSSTVSVTAQAGIDPHTKGMHIAQCFGASSSYARKYALNALFLIDDTRDPDDTNDHGKGDKTENKTPTQPSQPQTPLKPKEKAVIVVNNDKYHAAIKYLVEHKEGILAWDKVKSNYTISEMDQAQLLLEASDKLKEKKI